MRSFLALQILQTAGCQINRYHLRTFLFVLAPFQPSYFLCYGIHFQNRGMRTWISINDKLSTKCARNYFSTKIWWIFSSNKVTMKKKKKKKEYIELYLCLLIDFVKLIVQISITSKGSQSIPNRIGLNFGVLILNICEINGREKAWWEIHLTNNIYYMKT